MKNHTAILLAASMIMITAEHSASQTISKKLTIGQQLIEARSWIRTYHLKIDYSYSSKDGVKKNANVEVWYNGKSHRTDYVNLSGYGASENSRMIFCTDCNNKSDETLYAIQSPKSVSVVQSQVDNGTYAKNNLKYCDWQNFGLKIDRVFGPPRSSDLKYIVRFDNQMPSLEDSSAMTYAIKEHDSSIFTLVIDKKYMLPNLYTCEMPDLGLNSRIRILNEVCQDGLHAFPAQLDVEIHSTKGIIRTESVKFVLKEFNVDIDPLVFDITGLGLKSGTPVMVDKTKIDYMPTIQNGKLSEKDTIQSINQHYVESLSATNATLPSTPKPSLISQAWPYFLGFVVFAVLGFWLIFKQRKLAKEG